MRKELAQRILKQTEKNYRKIALEFSASRPFVWQELKSLAKYAEREDSVLDLGCGNGRLFDLFLGRKIKYLGIDIAPELIESAKRRTKDFGPDQLDCPDFEVGDACAIPAEDQSFNAIYSVALFHHLPSKEIRNKALKECKRVLRPGGYLIVTAWNLWRPKLLWKYRLWPVLLGWRPWGMDWKDVFIPWKLKGEKVLRYHHLFTLKELKKLVENNGFEILQAYITKGEEQGKWWNGKNIVVIGKLK